MAITNTTLASTTFNGNGATVAFATGFQFIANADLQVIVTSAAGVESVKTITTHYTVTGAGNPSGGTVTFLTAPITGEKVNIISNVTLDQQTDYLEGGSFSASTHETALDKLTKIAQQLQAQIDRSLQLPVSNQSVETTTGVITPGYALRVNDAGTALEWSSVTDLALGVAVTAYMLTLLASANAAAARTTLGVGTIATQDANNVTLTGGSVTGITDITLADGGTGASLADPGADRIMFWDDSAGAVTWLEAGSNLTITGTTIAASGGGSSDSFTTIAVSGQSDVVADSSTDTLTLVAGSNITITTNAGTDSITIAASGGSATEATQSDMETGTSTTTFVSPAKAQYHPSSVKAAYYVTYSGGVPTLSSNYNITSITDTAVGKCTITIATDFSSANYVPTVIVLGDFDVTTWANTGAALIEYNTLAVGSLVVQIASGAGFIDPVAFTGHATGDQ